jgi:hypothetical protein
MKVLKIVLIIFITLIILLTGGLFIFLKTFDLNKYVPQITEQAKKALGREVKIGRADLGFSFARGIALNVRDVVIADDARFSDKPFFSVDHVDVGLDVGALILAQKLQLTEVVIESPKIRIIRSREGAINAATIAASAPAPANTVPDEQRAAAAMPALLVKDIKVTGAELTYIDGMFSPELGVQINKIDIGVHDFSLTSFFDVTVNAAVFSSVQDLAVNARVQLDLLKTMVRIAPLKVSFDLAKIEAGRLNKELPMLVSLGFKQAGGVLSITAPEIVAGAKGVEGLKAQIVFEKGMLAASVVPVAVEDIVIKADVDEKQADIKTFSMVVAGGAVNGNALVVNYLTVPVVSAVVNAQGVDVKRLLASYNLPVSIKGKVEAVVNLKFSGVTPEEVMSSLDGDVKGGLKDGVLENVNLLALGLGNIPMLPGLLDSVTPSLSPESQEEVRKGVTVLQSCNVQARMSGGVVQLDAVDLATRDLLAHAQGTVDLKADMDVKADIRMAQDLSERLANSVKELSVLKDEQGRIYIPLGINGPIAKPKVMPDVEYLTKKLIAASGGEALQKVLGTPEVSEAVDAIFGMFKKK